MASGEATGIVEPPLGVVGTDVVTVPLPELLDGILNGPETRDPPLEAAPGHDES